MKDLIEKCISKGFTPEEYIITELCKIFEDGTRRKITKECLNGEKDILCFLKNIIPIVAQIGVPVTLGEDAIRKVVLSYIE